MDSRITAPACASKTRTRAVQRLSLSTGFVAEKKRNAFGMKFYSAEKKQRLTLSQAMVMFLQAQHSEYDGVEHRLSLIHI